MLANSFLMPTGYHAGLERVGTAGVSLANLGTTLTQAVALPIAKNPDGSTITGPAYEYNAGAIIA